MSNEPSEFDRIYMPRVERAVHAIELVAKGARLKPTEAQIAAALGPLSAAVRGVELALGTGTPAEPEIAPEPAPQPRPRPTEGWHHHDIARNIAAIPDEQLSAYATRLIARLCERFETCDPIGD